MSAVSRRDLLVSAGSFALAVAAATLGGSARAAIGPDDKFDLVIKGGDVLDPSQALRGKRDIGIRYGLIELAFIYGLIESRLDRDTPLVTRNCCIENYDSKGLLGRCGIDLRISKARHVTVIARSCDNENYNNDRPDHY